MLCRGKILWQRISVYTGSPKFKIIWIQILGGNHVYCKNCIYSEIMVTQNLPLQMLCLIAIGQTKMFYIKVAFLPFTQTWPCWSKTPNLEGFINPKYINLFVQSSVNDKLKLIVWYRLHEWTSQNKPVVQAAGADPSWCDSTNRQNPPIH